MVVWELHLSDNSLQIGLPIRNMEEGGKADSHKLWLWPSAHERRRKRERGLRDSNGIGKLDFSIDRSLCWT